MKFALDCHITHKVKPKLKARGFLVATVANDGESDEEWVQRAMSLDCDFIVSSDVGVGAILTYSNYHGIFIEVPQRLKGDAQADWIIGEIDFVLDSLPDESKTSKGGFDGTAEGKAAARKEDEAK